MIYFYSGRPGSGKSLHCAKLIDQYHRQGKNVICNFEVNRKFWEKKDLKKNKYRNRYGIIKEVNNEELTIEFLMDFANKYHERNSRGQIKEKQTLLIIDECQTMFNSRSWNQKGRSEWVIFFTQHRKFGYTVVLVSQHKDLIDKQIRHIFQYDYEHRNVKNFKLFGWLLALLCGGNLFFIPVKSMDTGKKDHMEIMLASKKYYRLYDSYKIFDTKTLKQL